MANASIMTAFERMWHHVTSALNNKSDITHNHDEKYQYQHGTISVTLSATGWSNREQLVSSNAVKKSSTLIVGAHPDNTSIYSECQIMCSSQEDGSLIFSCIETPTVDVMANVIILD